MSQPSDGGIAGVQNNFSSGRVSGPANSARQMLANILQAAKRPLNGPATELEPAIKRERLDNGYEGAVSNETSGMLLGTVVPSSSARMPCPVTVQSTAGLPRPRNVQPRRMGWPQTSADVRLDRTVNISRGNVPNNVAYNRPVVLLPQGAVAVPQQGSFPAFLPRPMVVPQTVQFIRGGPPTVSAPVRSSSAPVVVFVSQPSATRARVVRTRLSSAITTTSSTPFRHPVVTVLPATSQPNLAKSVLDPMAQLKATMFGRSVVDKYVGCGEPPSDLHMPAHTRRICQSCGDEFVTEVGLVDHMSRRSVHISFSCTCTLAKWPRLFYNPCMFDSFYRSHCVRPGPHASRNAVVMSPLALDTPEFRRACLDAQTQLTGAAMTGNKVSLSSENENNQQHDMTTADHVTATADSNGSCQHVPSAAHVKEIYVNVEVMPNEQRNRQMMSGEDGEKDNGSAVEKNVNVSLVDKQVSTGAVKKTNEHCVDVLASTANSRLAQSKSAVGGSSLPRVKIFSNALCHNRTKCPECSVDCKTRQGLSAHFSANRTKQRRRCADCGLVLSGCSFAAHRRLHRNRPPLVCPQCGIVFDEAESAAVFRAHVELCCFHVTQSSSSVSTSSCPRCSFKLSEVDGTKMAEHIVNAHATIYYKCRSCPKAFVSSSAAERHCEQTGHDAQRDTVHKCPLCDAVFKDGAGVNMQTHVVEHCSTPLFHCPVCSLSVSLSAVVEHMRSCHRDRILPETACEVCGQPNAGAAELFTHVSTKHVDYFRSVMKSLPLFRDTTSESEAESKAPSESLSCETLTIEPTTASESEVHSSASSTESFECTRCQMKFSSEHVYSRHQAKHRFLESKKANKNKSSSQSSADPQQQVVYVFSVFSASSVELSFASFSTYISA